MNPWKSPELQGTCVGCGCAALIGAAVSWVLVVGSVLVILRLIDMVVR